MAQWGAETYVGFFKNVLKNYTVFKNKKCIQLVFLNSDCDKMHGVFRIKLFKKFNVRQKESKILHTINKDGLMYW
jgi:hypothetical protein